MRPQGAMVVESVSTLDLRNLDAGEVELGPGVNLLWGPNGAGKTNLLEATYMALAGRSCRTRDDRQAIAFGKQLARAEAAVVDAAGRRSFLCSIARGAERRHLVDGRLAGPESVALRPALAVFMPDRLALVTGRPAGRRTHLDGFCAALWPSRSETRRRYSRALAQRNALLGRIRAGAAAPASLDAWDRELADAGIALIADRREAVDLLAPAFAQAARGLGLGDATLMYRPRSEAAESAALVLELGERRDGDLARGYTGWGPHLDDLALEAGARSLRRYGSQGQQRTALLALLFAEHRVLLDDGRPAPLMLLDDVASELDAEHRALLVDYLTERGGQALVTATEPHQLPRSAERREIALGTGRPLPAVAREHRPARQAA